MTTRAALSVAPTSSTARKTNCSSLAASMGVLSAMAIRWLLLSWAPSVPAAAISCNRDRRGSISRTDARCASPAGAVRGRRPGLVLGRRRRAADHAVGGQPARRRAGTRGRDAGGRARHPPGRADRGRPRADPARDRHLRPARRRRAGARGDRRSPPRPPALRLLPDGARDARAVRVRPLPPPPPGGAADRRRRSPAAADPAPGGRRARPRADLRERLAARGRRARSRADAAARRSLPGRSASRSSPRPERAVRSSSPTSPASPGSAARRRARGTGSSATPAGRAASRRTCGFTTDDYIAVQALVTAGLGVSVIPGLAVVHALPGLEVRDAAARAPRCAGSPPRAHATATTARR